MHNTRRNRIIKKPTLFSRLLVILLAPMTSLVVGLLLLALFAAIEANNNYMRARDVYVTVMDKQIIPKHYRYSERKELTYKSDEGQIFRQSVSDSTYRTSPIGEHYQIFIRPFDMHQTERETLIFFFGPVFSGVFGLGFLSFAFIGWYEMRRGK